MSTVTIYHTTSLDGRIADGSGGFEWISEQYSLDAFMARCEQADAVLVGRGAYRSYVESEMWPLPGRLIVLSTTAQPENAEVRAGSAPELVASLADEGMENLLLAGGTTTNTAFARAGLVSGIVLDIQPSLLGEGPGVFEDGVSVELRLRVSEQMADIMHVEFDVVHA